METLKYIVKRLVLAVVILLGVSVIIYGMSRMMPTDFVDQQYESALSQGTMTQKDVDHIKELYGLNMPDAFITITVGEGSKYAGTKFTTNTKQDIYEDSVLFGSMDYFEWYTGTTSTSTNATTAYDNGNLRLTLGQDGYCKIGPYIPKDKVSAEDISDDADIKSGVVHNYDEAGKFTIIETEDMELGAIRQIEVRLGGGNVIKLKVEYRTATGGEKFVAVIGGYFTWLGNLFQGDLGMSFKYKRPVSTVIFENMGISFAIALIATILQFLIAIPLGIKAATHQYGVVDYTVTILTMMGISLPTFFFSAILIRIFAVDLGWFEVNGLHSNLPVDATWIVRFGDALWHMILPMAVLVILSIGSLMRYTRTNTLEALNADYIRTARAKGLSEKTVIYKHAFRNTMVPLVTLLAGILPSLFGGAMITETVFSIPGIGKMAYEALVAADVPFIMGYNMFIAILTVVGTLLSDLMYAVVDPRVKIGR